MKPFEYYISMASWICSLSALVVLVCCLRANCKRTNLLLSDEHKQFKVLKSFSHLLVWFKTSSSSVPTFLLETTLLLIRGTAAYF